MDDDSNRLDRTDEDAFTSEVSDEALEAASGPGTPGLTVSLIQPNLFTCSIGCC